MRIIKKGYSLLAALCLVLTAPQVGAQETTGGHDGQQTWQPGQGWRIGDTGLTLGGYTSLQYQDLQNSNSRLALSHLSMFVWWESQSGLRIFSEIDNESQLSADTQSVDADGSFLSVERLYGEYAFNDALGFRLGKFLTPIGYWNQIHADPLVWTTSRPLESVALFPDHTSGAMVFGGTDVLGKRLDYRAYTSIGTDVRKDPAEKPFNEAFGVQVTLEDVSHWRIGLSAASFDEITNTEEHETLIGADFLWHSGGFEVSGEGVYRHSSLGSMRDGNGAFVQGVMPIAGKLYAVARLEHLRDPDLQQPVRLSVFGLNYRLDRAVSFKLETIRGVNQSISAPGWLASASMLF